ncbi:MAG: redoxin domain-containing protein [Verrucomicrobium sp.]|nr:redoxin domain-containing protein [Verrucomicrobium sp.]
MPLPVGSKAPDFVLKTKTAEGLVDVRLSDFAGKQNVVLVFFPLAFTSVCTQELCDLSSGLASYKDVNAQVLGISVDSPFTQEIFAQKEKIAFPLLSDLNKETAKAYDVVFRNLAGIGDTSARAAFVVDKEGTIAYSEQTPTPKDLPNFAAVKETLAKLK